MRDVFSAASLQEGEECQVYLARTGLPASKVQLLGSRRGSYYYHQVVLELLLEAEPAAQTSPDCRVQPVTKVPVTWWLILTSSELQVIVLVQFCSKRDYDICGLEMVEEEAPRTGQTEFDEFPVQSEFPGHPVIILTDQGAEHFPTKVETEEFVPREAEEENDHPGRGWRTEEPKLLTTMPAVIPPEEVEVTERPESEEEDEVVEVTERPESEQEDKELVDQIRMALFSPSTTPITVGVLGLLLVSSLAGLACLYCRGRNRLVTPHGHSSCVQGLHYITLGGFGNYLTGRSNNSQTNPRANDTAHTCSSWPMNS